MNQKGTGCASVDWMHLAVDMVQLRVLVNIVMNLMVPQVGFLAY